MLCESWLLGRRRIRWDIISASRDERERAKVGVNEIKRIIGFEQVGINDSTLSFTTRYYSATYYSHSLHTTLLRHRPA